MDLLCKLQHVFYISFVNSEPISLFIDDVSRLHVFEPVSKINLLQIFNQTDFLSDVKAVLLADKIFFCHEKDQRYSLVSVDSKPPVIYLKSLLAREVATGITGFS